MQAIILGSGRGARFLSLTNFLPKPLIPLIDRPLIDHLLLTLTKAGCTDIFVTIGYAGAQLFDHLTSIQVPAAITPVEVSDWERGPLASFQAALPLLSKQDPFILVPSDLYLSPTDLKLLLSTSAEVAILFDPVKHQSGTQIEVDSANRVCNLIQASALHKGHFSSLPAIRGSSEFLEFGLSASLEPQSTVFTLLQRWLAQGETLQAIPIAEQLWCDIDTPGQLLTLNRSLLTNEKFFGPPLAGVYVPANRTLEGPIQNDVFSVGAQSQILGPVFLGERVQVGEKCIIQDGTTLGKLTIVQDNSVLTNCITLPETKVPANVDIKAAILDAIGNIVHSP